MAASLRIRGSGMADGALGDELGPGPVWALREAGPPAGQDVGRLVACVAVGVLGAGGNAQQAALLAQLHAADLAPLLPVELGLAAEAEEALGAGGMGVVTPDLARPGADQVQAF